MEGVLAPVLVGVFVFSPPLPLSVVVGVFSPPLPLSVVVGVVVGDVIADSLDGDDMSVVDSVVGKSVGVVVDSELGGTEEGPVGLVLFW